MPHWLKRLFERKNYAHINSIHNLIYRSNIILTFDESLDNLLNEFNINKEDCMLLDIYSNKHSYFYYFDKELNYFGNGSITADAKPVKFEPNIILQYLPMHAEHFII